MATTEKSQTDIINAWQSLIEKSVKANTAFLEESAKLFTSLLTKKTDAKDFLKINTEVLNAVVNNFIKLNITNTENLMNFGVSISRSFFSFADTKNNNNPDQEDEPAAKHAEPAASNAKNQINLSVKQGEKISTSFYLNSHNAFAQTGKFYHDGFINEATGKKAALSMLISPTDFMLEPAKSVKVDISIDATKNIIPGKYTSTVKLEGMDNQEFDIVVDVLVNEPAAKQVLKPKAAVKRSPSKKPAVKNKK